MDGALAALAVLAAFAAGWEWLGSRERLDPRSSRLAHAAAGRARALAAAAVRLGVPARLARAGLTGRIPVGAVMGAKLAGFVFAVPVAALAAPSAPGRLSLVVAVALPVAGFLGPDALLERAARRRRRQLVVALPDALDLLAVAVSAGRDPGTALAELAHATGGPLGEELGWAMSGIEAGGSRSEALIVLREGPAPELARVAAAIERSRRHGSPLAERLTEQAAALRREQRRQIAERAARAAPKIQLVVAMILVPSVLLVIAAALLAHGSTLLSF